jgi:[ribosomal protein S5]-alanine N-acetyltransferase
MEEMVNALEIATNRSLASSAVDDVVITADWRLRLPVLNGERIRLRELRPADATSLLALLTNDEVTRFISPPPTTLEGFEGFIDWAARQRSAGSHAGFAATLPGSDTLIGLFQVTRGLERRDTAEWGFFISPAFWGTGLFREGAEMLLDFAFNTIGVHRLEARAATINTRGNGALLKIGAVPECVLRGSFVRHGRALDQMLYSIIDGDWRASRRSQPACARVH